MADLRNDCLKEGNISKEVQLQAREILNNPIDSYLNPSLWMNVKALENLLIDYWNSDFFKFFTPDPERVQAMRVLPFFEKNSINITFTDGMHRWRMFGIENEESYTIDKKRETIQQKF